MKKVKLLVTTFAALTTMAAIAPGAQASFHLLKIRAVFPGQTGSNNGFVELQATAPGQNLTQGQSLTFYNSSAGVNGTLGFANNAANGSDQMTILIGDTNTINSPDLTAATLSDLIFPSGGAVCWAGVDCVSWGSFTGINQLPSPPGMPTAALSSTQSTIRTTARGCSATLDAADDTNDSSADFGHFAPFTFTNNANSPIPRYCPNTSIAGVPAKLNLKQGKKSKTVLFKLVSTESGSTFACSLDGDPLTACSSPLRASLRKGTHTLKAIARNMDGVSDPSPALTTVRVVKAKKKHKKKSKKSAVVGRSHTTTPPETTITRHPPKKTHSTKAKFKFASSKAGTRFICKKGGGPFTPCTSPKKLKNLSVGRHTFYVRAVDNYGNTDPTAARFSFKVLG